MKTFFKEFDFLVITFFLTGDMAEVDLSRFILILDL